MEVRVQTVDSLLDYVANSTASEELSFVSSFTSTSREYFLSTIKIVSLVCKDSWRGLKPTLLIDFKLSKIPLVLLFI
jgi:hypothetical protein